MKVKASDVIKLAESWIGLNEADGSFKKIIDIYNTQKPLPRGYKVKYTDEWCATTVTALFVKLNALEMIFPECGCQEMINGFSKMGLWIEDESITPKVGDFVFYDWQDSGTGDDKGWADHVGIVYKVVGNTFKTIEGNWGGKVSVVNRTVNQKKLRGFARPNYAKEKTETTTKYYPKYIGNTTSIVDALSSLHVDSTFAHRKLIAKANGIETYSGTATQNTKMLSLLKTGKLIKE